MPVPGAIPAPLARRLLAFVIDVVAAVLLGGAFVAVGLVGAVTGEPVGPLPLVGAGVLVVLGLVQWYLLGTGGATLGRRLAGIRLVRVADGGAPGAGRALLRLLVTAVAWLVPVVGPVLLHTSPLADPRRRGWHDRMSGLMAVDVVAGADPASAAVAARRLDDVLRTGAPIAARPVRDPIASSAPPAAVVPRPVDAAPEPEASPPLATAPVGALLPSPQPSPEPVSAVPWQLRRETPAPADVSRAARHEPAAVVTDAPRPASALLDVEDTAGRAAARHVAEPADGPDRSRPRAPEPADGGIGDVTDTAGRPVTRIVPSSPAPVHTSTPFASSHEDEDVESTRLRPARGKVPELSGSDGPEVTVVLTDGQRVTITGTALVGRNPAPRPGEQPDHLIRVADPGRSVSKTHLLLGVDRAGLWLKDRDSTNGTVVTLSDGQQILCGAEQQVRLPAGASVAFGDYGLSVESADV